MIPPALAERMVAHLVSEAPNEGCGLLAGRNERVEAMYHIANADQSPVHYTLDSREQLLSLQKIDDADLQLLAIYHSHTRTPARPSPTDIEMATITGRFYSDILYVIVSLADRNHPDIRAFRIEAGVVTEAPVVIGDAEERAELEDIVAGPATRG